LNLEEAEASPFVSKMLRYVCDDLNTVGMFGFLFEHLPELKKDKLELCRVKLFLQQVLGLTLQPLLEKEVPITPQIQKLLDERETARAAKDWNRADSLRDQLQALGIEVQDKKMVQK
jgi:cysteinyl-tRNA synthetase